MNREGAFVQRCRSLANVPGGLPEDMIGLLRLPGIDWEYIVRHAAAWDVEDRLAQVLPDPAEPDA